MPVHTLLFLLALLSLLSACSGQALKDPDHDHDRSRARPFRHLEPTLDKLDVQIGDQEDWRWFEPLKSGRLLLRVSVGKWNPSTLQATVTVFTVVGDRLLERPVAPGTTTLEEAVDVVAGTRYLVRFQASAGAGEYAVQVEEPSDSCAECTPAQICQDGRCVDKPCGGACGEDERCDEASGRCVAEVRPRRDRCQEVDCPAGQVCQRGRCVPSRKPVEVQAAPDRDVACRVIDARSAGSGSLLILGCGDNKGIRKGMTGTVPGVAGGACVVTEVYPSRSKVVCKAPPARLVNHDTVVVSL